MVRFSALLDAGEFHAAHDVLEPEWKRLDRASPEARALQGLIQAAVAWEHLRRGWPDRFRRMAAKALPKLEGVRIVDGFDAAALRERLRRESGVGESAAP